MGTDTLLIILFGRWLGIYKFDSPDWNAAIPIENLWHHAIAFSKADKLPVRSLEMSCFDEQMNVNLDEEEEQKRESEIESKVSIKDYIFIHAEGSLIAIHPLNPTFDHLHIAKNVKPKTSYCMSKRYGTFWIDNDGEKILQSPQYDANKFNVACGKKENYKYVMVKYDESFGISGRLLAICKMKIDNTISNYADVSKWFSGIGAADDKHAMFQLFNQNELIPLKDELVRTQYQIMPGMSMEAKPFNLTVFVYEMLYGSECVNALIQSDKFNAIHGNRPVVKQQEKKPGSDIELSMSSKHCASEILESMKFPSGCVQRALQVYENEYILNYGSAYNVDVIIGIVMRLQGEDKSKWPELSGWIK